MRKLETTEIKRLSIEEIKEIKKLPIIVILNDVRSLHNIGAIFRTCDAFLCESIFLCGITGTPPNREIHKTALGATETVEWKYFNNIFEALNILTSENYKLVSLEIAENSINIENFKLNTKEEKIALIVGNEMNGIDQDVLNICNTCIEIPQFGTKHSLNVSVSTGIALWKISTEMRNLK